jgi:small GTP-binding protein
MSSESEVPPPFARLTGHQGVVGAVAWSPSGSALASVSDESGLIVFDLESGLQRVDHPRQWSFGTIDWHRTEDAIAGIAGREVRVVSGSSLESLLPPELRPPASRMAVLSWAPERRWLAHTSYDDNAMIYRFGAAWAVEGVTPLPKLSLGGALRWSSDGNLVAAKTQRILGEEAPSRVCVWDPRSGNLVARLSPSAESVTPDGPLAWSPDGVHLAYATRNIVAVHRTRDWRRPLYFEHGGDVDQLLWSPCGRYLVSLASGRDSTALNVWETDTWDLLAEHPVSASWGKRLAFAFHPDRPLLALATGSRDTIEVFDIEGIASTPSRRRNTQRYTTAKVVVVGDSGVGKTGLGYRIATREYIDHPSTHGQNFWVVDALGMQRADGTECEVVLWDLAGQPDYRLTHVLFLDDADAAIVMFDATRGHAALDAVAFWIDALQMGREVPCPIILVGGRLDRGGASISEDELESFCERHGITGGYVGTSARTGLGVDELLTGLREVIPWSAMAATITTAAFRSIKDHVLRLKQRSSEEEGVAKIMGEAELADLVLEPATERVTHDELLTAVRNLEVHGYVRVLRTAGGERVILLQPELLHNLASSIILAARQNERGLGAIDEGLAIDGGYRFPEVEALPSDHGQILLDAGLALLLEHNVCFREPLGTQALLIFPELINEKPPTLADDADRVDDVTYVIEGNIQNVYASLVVLLGYTNVLVRRNQWQDRAEYEMDSFTVGFEQTRARADRIELTLFYEGSAPVALRRLFQGLVEQFLRRRRVSVRRYPQISCGACGFQLDRTQVIRFVDKGIGRTYCPESGDEIAIPTNSEAVTLSGDESAVVEKQSQLAARRTALSVALAHLRSYIAEVSPKRSRPVIFISYAWGDPAHEQWVQQRLVHDLLEGEIEVILDRRECRYGDHIGRFVNRIESADHVLVVGTPRYREKYDNRAPESGTVVAAEMDLIYKRLMGSEDQKATVIPVLRAGSAEESFPPLLHGRVYADLTNDRTYVLTLFEVVLQLWGIPRDAAGVEDLIDGLGTDISAG